MGAWSLGLLQSDHDTTRLDELIEQAGLPKLEQQHARASKGKKYVYDCDNSRDSDADPEKAIYYTIVGWACSDVPAVRKHLDSGVLSKMISDWDTRATTKKTAKKWPTRLHVRASGRLCDKSRLQAFQWFQGTSPRAVHHLRPHP
jgi:hypothetical protein